MSKQNQFVLLEERGGIWGLPLHRVELVTTISSVVTMPMLPRGVVGHMIHRDRLAPVVDMDAWVYGQAALADYRRPVVLFRVEAGLVGVTGQRAGKVLAGEPKPWSSLPSDPRRERCLPNLASRFKAIEHGAERIVILDETLLAPLATGAAAAHEDWGVSTNGPGMRDRYLLMRVAGLPCGVPLAVVEHVAIADPRSIQRMVEPSEPMFIGSMRGGESLPVLSPGRLLGSPSKDETAMIRVSMGGRRFCLLAQRIDGVAEILPGQLQGFEPAWSTIRPRLFGAASCSKGVRLIFSPGYFLRQAMWRAIDSNMPQARAQPAGSA